MEDARGNNSDFTIITFIYRIEYMGGREELKCDVSNAYRNTFPTPPPNPNRMLIAKILY